MKAVLCFAVVLLYVGCSHALDCPDCELSKCPEVHCRFGQTKDVCACCPACYKGVGEECGGPWNVFGFCANHLTCIKPPAPDGKDDPIHDFNAVGKCLALP